VVTRGVSSLLLETGKEITLGLAMSSFQLGFNIGCGQWDTKR
jgi:hypothetical protein